MSNYRAAKVKILTDDNELVTRHVCEQVGLDASRLVLGSELDQMTEEALASVVEQVFALRVVPCAVAPVSRSQSRSS